ncbi:MAG: hypothetical protein A3F67_04775 [Verrucomicrobia bacterium RIFCSPHIGHO2_12_FULL_41_10]|nr:MAG: hypothetical protein A3F67_04775 [Verrucomicrobia bacterium RIFCSPHIGHO2_12_FULL_41_10]HLB34249.1 type II toxin-antitoxin system VapC family toxin [Chthoniobacterales bacterium]
MKCYCDTSILASLYLCDEHSEQVAIWIQKTERPIPLTPLTELELTGAIQQRLFRKEISEAEAMESQQYFQQDILTGFYQRHFHQGEEYQKALQLVLQHTSSIGCRTLDVLHIASALTLNIRLFATYDLRQKMLARKIGLNTIDF